MPPRSPDHFENLRTLLSLERRAAAERFREARVGKTLEELEKAGQVLLDAESIEEEVGLGGRVLVTIQRHDRRAFSLPLYPGDLVEIRPRKAEVSEPAVATVSQGGRTRATLAFERPPPPFVREGRLRIDPLPNDVSFDRANRALSTFAALEKGAERRKRDVVLGVLPPRFDRLPEVAFGRPLNPEQQDAAKRALAAEDLFLVHGPPGTGKSSVLAEVAYQAVARGERLLCAAASNAAVDHLLSLLLSRGINAIRIGHPARVAPELQRHTLDLLVEEHPDRILSRELFDEGHELLGYARKQRSQGRSRERFSNARASKSEAYALFDEARILERKAVRAVLDRAEAVCLTCTAIESSPVSHEVFDRVLLDEATQAIEPVALAALLRGKAAVLAGDHRQLPPTVISLEAQKRGLSVSLFERLRGELPEDATRMLREQYRMNEGIMDLPSRTFYGGELRAHPSVASRTLREVVQADLDAPPVLFLDTAGKGFDEEGDAEGSSRRNEGEARLVVARARELLAAGLAPTELAIISPYLAQVALIRELLALPDVEVDTVDAFQGREKDAVLISLVRSNGNGEVGFLKDLRRINVALTRARRHVFVVGDSATVSSEPFFATLVEETQKNGGYRSAWEWPEP